MRLGHRLGKYRIEKRIAKGPFAAVYRAFDTIEGNRVALKVPHPHLTDEQFIEDFRKEVRLTVRLDHRNILPVKNASFIDGQFVIVLPLGQRTLAERMRSRMALVTIFEFTEQMIVAVAHAHGRRIIHCDIKPENFILFDGNELRLADFGISKMARKTIKASGSGTLGYVAPEQAMGRPSFRSDVFSLGLIIYRLLTGQLPEWPFDWPPAGYQRLRRRAGSECETFLRRSMEVRPARRFRDAEQMLGEFRKLRRKIERRANGTAGKGRSSGKRANASHAAPGWREVRWREFQRSYRKLLGTRHECPSCSGPVAETMQACPWCGYFLSPHCGDTDFPAHCPRCKRGAKLDWAYCAWCYGAGFEIETRRRYADHRYKARCGNRECPRGELMPFMRFCPWCRTKLHKRWKIPGSRETCGGCGWGVVGEFWKHCPWCARGLGET